MRDIIKNMNSKNVLITLIGVLIGLVTFLGGYILARKDGTPQSASIYQLERFNNKTATEGIIDNIGSERSVLERLSTVKVLNPTISESGREVVYFEKGTGKILSADFSGKSTNIVSGEIINDLNDANWSKNGIQVIFNQQGKYTYFNVKTGARSKLNQNISHVTWSRDGKKIAYLFYDDKTGEGNISIASPDGSSFKNVFKTRAQNLKLNWPKENLLSFYAPFGLDKSLFLLNFETGKLEKILDQLDDLEILWSPDGSHLLYSYRDRDNLSRTKLLDLEKQIDLEIDLLTSTDKCVWTLDSLSIYCGAEKEAGFENLYQLDLVKKEFGLIFKSSVAEPMTISSPLLSPIENYFFFIDQQDSYLYGIKL